jgi:AcrR family transcriptional regulator
MSPRNYDMTRRAAAVEETRRRIVDATLALHAEQGIAATRWDEIAARAGVGVGTVYRHFPSLDELVPACGAVARRLLALPDPDDIPSMFDGADGPHERVERLVAAAFAIYERGAHIVRAALRERDVHPDVAHSAAYINTTLDALVDAALDPIDAASLERRLTRGMVDVATWTALRGQELGPQETVAVVSSMLSWRLARQHRHDR